jgi:hypothetical protein
VNTDDMGDLAVRRHGLDANPIGRPPPWRLGERARRQLLAGTARRALARSGSSSGSGADAGSRRSDLHEALAAAIREDTAASLGRAGRRLAEAVVALQAVDGRMPSPTPADRDALADEAAQALWACVVQREALGLFDHRILTDVYRVPAELWRRMGGSALR